MDIYPSAALNRQDEVLAAAVGANVPMYGPSRMRLLAEAGYLHGLDAGDLYPTTRMALLGRVTPPPPVKKRAAVDPIRQRCTCRTRTAFSSHARNKRRPVNPHPRDAPPR